ncbi:MAG: GNAT family N-acetyltransferase [Pseudomonadota bacterium]
MEIIQATAAHVEQFDDDLPELMHSTGPAAYDYQFLGRKYFDPIVRASWAAKGTLFAFDGSRLAVEGDELLGIEIGWQGPEFQPRKKALAPVWGKFIEDGTLPQNDLAEMAERTYLASYLNVAIPKPVHYIHALAVKPEHRGKGIGAALVRNAIQIGKDAGNRGLHLDVLSDNPAVEFYRALGMQCLAETRAPIPFEHGCPVEMRMAMDF